MPNILVIIIVLTAILQVQAATLPDTCNQATWVTNGLVYAIVPAGDKVYIGGNFTQIGPYTGGWAPVNSSTGAPAAAFPRILGVVNAICPDGNGGWFIAGVFSSIDGMSYKNIAHILSNGSVDPAWNPRANSSVLALAVSGKTVYAGGLFDTIDGQSRHYIAALDAASGKATVWNPNAGSSVHSLAVSGATVYAGGDFSSIGDSSRIYIAALDSTTGKATAWNPKAGEEGYVSSIVVSGTTVYAGGIFTSIGDSSRNNIAALNATTGKALAWNPNANLWVNSIVVNGPIVYAGGLFSNIGGQNRNFIAALDATTGKATDWNPNVIGYAGSSNVNSILVSGSTIYAGGNFYGIGGASRNFLAALDAATGKALDWNPNANNSVQSLAMSGTTVYIGGNFSSIGDSSRNNIAELDAASGSALAWNPKADSMVISLVMCGPTLYAGGKFTSIGGQSRIRIAALDTSTGNATDWNPNANGYVMSLAATGSTVYAGGMFTSIGGQSRNRIAALATANGTATAWDPNANNNVRSLTLSGTKVFAAGDFFAIGDSGRNNIAALDITTGKATAWNPNPNSSVYSLAVSGAVVYAGGNFTSIGGQSRSYIAAIDTTGKAISWNPNPNGFVQCLAVSGTTVYAGGNFTGINGQNRSRIAALDATTGVPAEWNPNANNVPFSMALNGTAVYVGGFFQNIGQGVSHPYFAQFGNYYPALGVQSISPSSGVNNALVQITNLNGSNFRSGATVKLVKAGQPDINATGVSVISSSRISCTVDITNATTGAWDVIAANGDTKSDTLIQGFLVALPPPVLTGPGNDAINISLTPVLLWYKAANDSVYTVQLSASGDFSSLMVNNNLVSNNNFPVPSGMLSNYTAYFWRVCATKIGGEVTVFSSPWKFTTLSLAPGIPTLLLPSDNSVDVSLNYVITWNRVNGAATYRLQIGADSLFNTIVMQDSTLTDTAKSCATLVNDTKYFWRVNATNPGGTGAWSAVRRFTTMVAIPSAVTLKTLATGDTAKADSVFLAWSAGTPKVDRYSVEYATDSSFTTSTVDTTVSDTVKLVRGLQNNTTVWWKVKAHNAAGWGDWSNRNVFTVKLITTHARPASVPKTFSFNIFGRTGSIRYALPRAEHVFMRVYSINGQLQSEPVNMQQAAGYYTVTMQRGFYAAGSYLVAFRAGDFYQKKMVFLTK